MASSGSIYTGYDNNTRFYMDWRVADQDITNNRTLVSWEIGVQGTSGRTSYWYSNAIRINSAYLNGSQVSGSHTYSNITLQGSGKHRLRSGSIWVGHTSSGSKSFSMSISGWFYSDGNKSASGSWSLPTIPRNSQVSTNATSYTLGDAIGIITNRKSSSFTHTITIRLHNSSGTILQTINNVGASTTWTPTTAQIETMENAIPSTNKLTLYIRQYNNQVKDDSTVTRTLTLADANPEFDNFTFRDSNSTVSTITGNDQVLVKGQSTLEVKVPSADKMVAIKGASESRYDFAYDGTSNQETYATTDVTSTFSTIATAGTRTIQVTAYDSRSNTTRVSKNVTVYDYSAPTITTTLERENNFGTDTTISIEGTYTPLVIGGSAKNSPQTGTLQYRYKEDGGAFGSWTTKTFTDNGDGTYEVTPFVLALNNQNKYLFEFHIDDEFGTVTVEDSVDVGTPIMFVGQNNGDASVGINKMPENGALDVEGDIYSNGEKVKTEASAPRMAVGSIDVNSTGSKTINIGFQPDYIELEGTFASSDVSNVWSKGYYSASESYCMSTASRSSYSASRLYSYPISLISFSATGALSTYARIDTITLTPTGFVANLLTYAGSAASVRFRAFKI